MDGILQYPVRGVSGDPCQFFCIPCCKKLSCDHQGLKDVTYHCKKESRKANVESSKKQSSMTSFLTSARLQISTGHWTKSDLKTAMSDEKSPYTWQS